jgi:hypothetical protein
MTRTYYRELTLDGVLDRASDIVVAEPVGETSFTAEWGDGGVATVAPGATPGAISGVVPVHIYRVLEVLHGELDAAATPEVRVIHDPNWKRQLELSARYQLEGVGKSPIYERFPEQAIEPGAPRILFLARGSPDRPEREAVGSAVLPLSRLAEVRTRLAARSTSP